MKTRRSPPRTPQRVHTRARFLGRKHHHFILNENSSGPAGRIKCALHVAPRTTARGLCPALPGSRKHLGAPITSTLTGQASPSRPISTHIGYARAPNSQGTDSPDRQPCFYEPRLLRLLCARCYCLLQLHLRDASI